MAIDTAAKRRNILNIATSFLFLGLASASGVDAADRKNLSEVYVGYTYAPPVIPVFAGITPVNVHVGVGF